MPKDKKTPSGGHPAAEGKRPGHAHVPKVPGLPPLRPLQARQVRVTNEDAEPSGGQRAQILLEDPEAFAPEPVMLTPEAFALASLFDGERTAAQVAEMFTKVHHVTVTAEEVLHVSRQLDEALLLASPYFENKVRRAIQKYLQDPVRPATHAGQAYPEEAQAAQAAIEGFFTLPKGPGGLPPVVAPAAHGVAAAMLPHIDLRVGGATYAHGYKALLEGCQADLFVILGVAHRGTGTDLFYVSTKDFATPLGTAPTARDLAEGLQRKFCRNPALAEYVHKTEHSIEFQALMLAGLLGARAGRTFEIVPVLCGSIEPFIQSQKSPSRDDEFVRFTQGVREALEQSGRRWCLLASVDLSHVGPKFDHCTSITERLLLPVERYDRRILSKLEDLDAEGFYAEIFRTQNSRNVDAVLAMLALLEIGKGVLRRGKVLHYDAWLEAPTKSAVSFAAMSFESGAT